VTEKEIEKLKEEVIKRFREYLEKAPDDIWPKTIIFHQRSPIKKAVLYKDGKLDFWLTTPINYISMKLTLLLLED
jgi:hypothetical protein